MRLDFEGRRWQLDMEDVTTDQAVTITAYTGLSLLGFYKSLLETEEPVWLKSMQALYWLIRQQNSDPVDMGYGAFAPLKLLKAFNDAATAEFGGDGEAEPDPTKPAGGNAAEEPPEPLTSAG